MFSIKTSEYNAGLIYAETGRIAITSSTIPGSEIDRVSVNIEKFTENRIKIRLAIQRSVFNHRGIEVKCYPPEGCGYAEMHKAGPVEDPKIYQNLYAEIQKEMFRRAQLNR